MVTELCIIVWCDSPLGLISTRVDETGKPCTYKRNLLDTEHVKIATHPKEIFAILSKKDGRKVAIPTVYVRQTLGWTL